MAYAAALDIPFVYSSNGDAFLEHDRTGAGITVERSLTLEQFPTPDELWQRYMGALKLDDAAAAVFTQDYHYELGGKTARMLDPFKNLGRPLGLIRAFGGKQNYVAAVRELNRQLYLSA